MKKSTRQKFPRDVFFALSHQIRRQIMQILSDKPTTISNISKETKFSMQLLGKHLRILYDAHLVRKQEDSAIHLTQYGKTVTNQLRALEFLDNNEKYFQSHSLEYLPEEFVERIGELQISKRINSHTLVIEKAKEQYSLAKDQVKTIVDDIQMEIYKHVLYMMNKNRFHVHVIFSDSTVIPKGWSKVAKEKEIIQKRLIHRRTYKGKFHCIMQVSELEGFIIFPNNDGLTDPRTVFYSQDKRFKKWCSDLFDFFWKNSNTFVMSQATEG